MSARIYKSNILAGLLPALLGACIVAQSLSYGMGTMRVIGPGVYPMLLGIVLTALGLAIVISERHAKELAASGRVEWRSLLTIAAAVLSFALTIEPLGLFPSVWIGAFIAGWADEEASLKRNVLLGLIIAAFCSFVFIICLQLPIPLFDLTAVR